MINIMIDTETLGMSESAIILSVGAVVFDIDRDLGDEFYMELDPEEYQGSIHMSTIKFWMDQETKCPMKGISKPLDVILGLNYWIMEISKGQEVQIWCNGTDFDIPKLTYMYGLKNTPLPWKYNSVRDYRTIAKLFGEYGNKPETIEKHNALEDAKWQAKHLISIVQSLKVSGLQCVNI